MPTPRFRHRATTSNQSRRDWKDHPLVVGVGAVVATSVFFMTVVIPLRFDLLTSKVERLTELSTNAAATAEELEKTKRKLADMRGSLQASLKKSPFHGRSVYPIGFDEVVVGTSKAELLRRYPNGQWDKNKHFYTVRSEFSTGVRRAAYFFPLFGEQRYVSKILFFLPNETDGATSLAQKHFLMSFGEPDAKRGSSEFLWKATDREWVEIDISSPGFGVYSVIWAKSLESDYLSRFLSQ